MKKVLAIVLLLALCASVAVACCACDNDGTITVTVYSTMGIKLKATFESYIQEFNNMYPNIKVVHETPENKYETLHTNINAKLKNGYGPSIAYCYPDHVAAYMQSNRVVSLDSFINSTDKVPVGKFGNTEEYPIGWTQAEIDDFVSTFYNEGKDSYGDGSTMYSLPYAKSTEVLYYNKDFFTENKIEVPTHWFATTANVDDDKTSMEYVCKRILEIDTNCIPLGYDSDSNFFITMCEQYMALEEYKDRELYTSTTGEHYLFDNEVTKGFMTKWNELFRKGYLTTQGVLDGKYTSTLFTARTAAAPNAKCTYMCVGSTGGSTYQIPKENTFEVGIAPLPQMSTEPSRARVISQGPSICMLKTKNNRSADQQLANWLFAKYMVSCPELLIEYSMESGYLPALKSAQNNPVYLAHLAKANGREYISAAAALECQNVMYNCYTSATFTGSADAREQVGILFAKCLQMQPGAETLAQQMDKAFDTAIRTCKFNV